MRGLSKYFFFITGFIFLYKAEAFSQSVYCDSTTTKKGTVKIYSSPEWKSLAFPPADVEISDEPKLQGYRVQVFSGSHRNDANQVKVQVLQSFPDQPVYFLYEAPYFKVRVGDFRNKLEAQKVLHELKIKFTDVLLVPDKINLPAVP